jgi:hypothetical protein
MLFRSLVLPGKILYFLRMKIMLDLNSAFLVHVEGIDTDYLTEEKQEQEQEKEPVLTP